MHRLAINPVLDVIKSGSKTEVRLEGSDYFVRITKKRPKWYLVELLMAGREDYLVRDLGVALLPAEGLMLAERALLPYLPRE